MPISTQFTSLSAQAESLITQAGAVIAELRSRLVLFDAVVVTESNTGVDRLALALQQVRALLGADVVLLPLVDAQVLRPCLNSVLQSFELQGGTSSAVDDWLQQMAYVRDGAARLQVLLTYAHAFEARAVGDLRVGQWPWTPGDRWAALPPAVGMELLRGRTSIVLHAARPIDLQAKYFKLLLHDAWTELVPAAEEVTGVTFHHDQPGATAPNLALLAIAEPGRSWSAQRLSDTVFVAVDLAKSRAAPADGRTELLWFDDRVPAGASESEGFAWMWDHHDSSLPSGYRSHFDLPDPQWTGHWSGHRFYGAPPETSLVVGADETLFAYVRLDASQMPRSVKLSWSDGIRIEKEAVWGEPGRQPQDWVGPLPPAGVWSRLEVPSGRLGAGSDGIVSIKAMSFSFLQGAAAWNRVGKLTAAGSLLSATDLRNDRQWFSDRLPAGALPETTHEDSWHWTARDPIPYGPSGSGSASHRSPPAEGLHGHAFRGARDVLVPRAGDRLYVYAYLDPAHPPTALILQWAVGGELKHRAFWGGPNAPEGFDSRALGTAALIRMGDVPPSGRWIRLEVPCEVLALHNKAVDGMGFSLVDGSAAWGPAGLSKLAMSNVLIFP